MPIKIADGLPARHILEAEGVIVMRETDAVRQGIRPLRIGLLNLMPNNIAFLAIAEPFLATHLGGRAEPLADEELARSTAQIIETTIRVLDF